jgi:beta-glucosidase-like glycosyl hydrolase
MPGATKWRGEMLLQAVGIGKVPQTVLDERARNVLNLVNRCSKANIADHAPEETANTPETAALLRKIGADSIVLMKNEGDILPLRKDKKVGATTSISEIRSVNGLDPYSWPKCKDGSLSRRRLSFSSSILCSNSL